MAYEIYKKKETKENYFSVWDSASYNRLQEDLKIQIYEKYLIKCDIFQRDDFTCQNKNCEYCNNVKYADSLTMHHIKWQKNDGKNKVRNGITLCNESHQAYHRGETELVFGNTENIPTHIRGRTFKFKIPKKFSWKKVKAEMKKLRRGLKSECGIHLSWEQLNMLMKFLEYEVNEEDD